MNSITFWPRLPIFYADFSFFLMGTREVYFSVPSIDHSLSLRFVGGGMGH